MTYTLKTTEDVIWLIDGKRLSLVIYGSVCSKRSHPQALLIKSPPGGGEFAI